MKWPRRAQWTLYAFLTWPAWAFIDFITGLIENERTYYSEAAATDDSQD